MRQTLHLQASSPEDVTRAAALLRQGRLVAFATETVYGLGAHACSAEAVAGIFAAKGRPSWDPLIVHLADRTGVAACAWVGDGEAARVDQLMTAFWPGPLTLLLPRRNAIPDAVTAGRPLVGLRVPAHPAAQALLREAGVPVAAPSANRFGHISPTTAEHVLADLDGRIDAVLDAGPCTVGVESTVLNPAGDTMTLYRAGAVTPEALWKACGVQANFYEPGEVAKVPPEALPSPGVGMRHYAPSVPLVLTAGTPEAVRQAVPDGNRRVGVLLPEGWESPPKALCWPWGRWDRPQELAARLFAGLRALETAEVDVMVCPLPAPGGLRDALRDRLQKAARP